MDSFKVTHIGRLPFAYSMNRIVLLANRKYEIYSGKEFTTPFCGTPFSRSWDQQYDFLVHLAPHNGLNPL